MAWQEYLFVAALMLSLASLAWFLGASITGFASQSMYCDGLRCAPTCIFDTDCPVDQRCCDAGGFGLCADADSCMGLYRYEPEILAESIPPHLERPRGSFGPSIALYASLLLIAIAIGALYLATHKRR